MIRVYFTNHFYYADREFATLDEAVAYAKSVCFQVSFWQPLPGPGNPEEFLGSWCPIGGLRLQDAAKELLCMHK